MRLATDVIITIINSGHLKLKNIGGQIITDIMYIFV